MLVITNTAIVLLFVILSNIFKLLRDCRYS